ncbi:MAG TPA: STAS domain-containing protein [Burkholderiaceae bacterium]
MTQLDFVATHHEEVTVIAVQGSVDSLTADRLTEALGSQVSTGRIRLVADFGAVEYTSSAGLRSLLGSVKESRRLGGDLRMAAVQPAVLRVLSLSGFASIIKIYDDVDSAIASYGGAA